MNDYDTISEYVRQAEGDYVNGSTQISEHVIFSMYDTLNRIDAYLNSKHISGEKDALGRDKPFYNICTAAVNIWERATDIDRKDIKIRATDTKSWINSFLGTVVLQDWMRREYFGTFLNKWGRALARYGSVPVKFVRNSSGLHISVIPWNRIICDVVDFAGNPKIEIIELTEAQLRERIETHSYDEEQVKSLIGAFKSRETIGGDRKDNRSHYIKLYEVHGVFPLSFVTDKDGDENIYAQQMHVVSYVAGKNNQNRDFTLVSGREKEDPYMITHLMEEPDRTLSIGAVEHLFEAQWMQNHSVKQMKDHLDLALKLLFQTSDPKFLGRNAVDSIESGDILIHAVNQPITQLNNQSHDLVSAQNYAVMWKNLGNEIVGTSEAMLGATPKSGTAWRQTEALLQENYNLFEKMTENKGLHIEEMMRKWIIPYLKTKLDTSEEVSAILESHDINRIDRRYIRNELVRKMNKFKIDKLLKGEIPSEEEVAQESMDTETNLRNGLSELGNQRFFKPSEISDKTWKEQLKDLEWDVEIDVTGEAKNVQEAMATLSTALQMMMNPVFAQNEQAQLVVSKILELSGAMSPVELQSMPSPIQQNQLQQPLQTNQINNGTGQVS